MKKFFSLILSGMILFFGMGSFVWAEYQVSQENKWKVDMVMQAVESQWGKEDIFWQIERYQKIVDSFSKIKLSWDQKEMIDYLVHLFEGKLTELKKSMLSQSDLIKNVNWDEVEKTILNWHNEERIKLWLEPYKINKKLNHTATVWANELARMVKKSNTHTRKAWDGYYNYNKILSWFNEYGVSFDYKLTAFTESVAYQSYSCNKDDCTQDMITALKKWFDFWMSEKWKSSRPHYNAIVSNVFTDLWFGVGVSGNLYWIVAHYGINVK